MANVHELKCWAEAFVALEDGTKKAEFRRDDRGFQVNDLLVLREWMPEHGGGRYGAYIPNTYTGRVVVARITHILRKKFGVPEGYAMLSLHMLRDDAHA